jgi:ribosomal protein S18 acetylase RimI-like enzyme
VLGFIMSAVIRHAIDGDVLVLSALLRDCVAGMFAAGIEQWDEVYPNEEIIHKDIAAGTLHVLDKCDRVIGCVTLDDQPDPLWQGLAWSDDGTPFIAVHRLMIHPSQQGCGLARKLMQHAEAVALEKGCGSIRLDTFTQNPGALALYEKLGYRRTGIATMRKGLFIGFEKML